MYRFRNENITNANQSTVTYASGFVPDLNVPALGADYFCGNLHKWFLSPRGAAFLYVRPGEDPEPLVVSHGYGEGFNSNFIWHGAADYSAALALPQLAEWWRNVGLERAISHNANLRREAVDMLAGRWHTEPLTDYGGPRALVRVPFPEGVVMTSADGKALQDRLHFDYAIECPVKTVNGKLYVRISAAVYNEHDDYHRLAQAVEEIALIK